MYGQCREPPLRAPGAALAASQTPFQRHDRDLGLRTAGSPPPSRSKATVRVAGFPPRTKCRGRPRPQTPHTHRATPLPFIVYTLGTVPLQKSHPAVCACAIVAVVVVSAHFQLHDFLLHLAPSRLTIAQRAAGKDIVDSKGVKDCRQNGGCCIYFVLTVQRTALYCTWLHQLLRLRSRPAIRHPCLCSWATTDVCPCALVAVGIYVRS